MEKKERKWQKDRCRGAKRRSRCDSIKNRGNVGDSRTNESVSEALECFENVLAAHKIWRARKHATTLHTKKNKIKRINYLRTIALLSQKI